MSFSTGTGFSEHDQEDRRSGVLHGHDQTTPPLHVHHHEELGGFHFQRDSVLKECENPKLQLIRKIHRPLFQFSYQENTTGGIPLEGSTPPAASNEPHELPCPASQGTGRSLVAEQKGAQRHAEDSPSSTGSGHTGGIGRDADALRQVSRQNVCRSVSPRSCLREATVESKGNEFVGPELSTLLQTSSGSKCAHGEPRSRGDRSTVSADAGSAKCAVGRGSHHQETRASDNLTKDDSTSQIRDELQGLCTSAEPKDLVREGRCRMASYRDGVQDEQERTTRASEEFHGVPVQPRSSEPAECSDCDLAARSSARTARAISSSYRGHVKWLTPQEMVLLSNSLEQRTQEIQTKLKDLKGDPKYCDTPKIKSGRPMTKGAQKKANRVCKKIDLLEVYCEPESQLTRVCDQKGGRAERFTRDDGDLTTKERVEKLWVWIEVDEPSNIWVAPKCILWGN